MSNEAKKPEKTLSDGAIKASIWKRESAKGSYYATTFGKTYRDEQGNFQTSHSFAGTDLLKIHLLSKQAYDASRELYYKDRRQTHDQQKAPEPERER